jgi:hypothetical protein
MMRPPSNFHLLPLPHFAGMFTLIPRWPAARRRKIESLVSWNAGHAGNAAYSAQSAFLASDPQRRAHLIREARRADAARFVFHLPCSPALSLVLVQAVTKATQGKAAAILGGELLARPTLASR